MLEQELAKFKRVLSFSMPFQASMRVTTLVRERCKVMESAKAPLRIVFSNEEEATSEPVEVIFKTGDDLRQDALTLQLFHIMDEVIMVMKMKMMVVARLRRSAFVLFTHDARHDCY